MEERPLASMGGSCGEPPHVAPSGATIMSLTGFSGAAGIKYGLNVRGPKKPAGALPRPTLAAFAAPSDDEVDDDDDGGDGRVGANAQIARQQQKAAQKARRGEASSALRCSINAS